MIAVLFSVLIYVTGLNEDPVHALYLSVSEMEILDDSVTVTTKVFSDDLYNSLRNFYTAPSSTIDNFVTEEVEAYFNEKIKVELGSHVVYLNLINMSREGDSYFIHFRSLLPSERERIKIQLRYFYELFPSQRNILKLKTPSQQYHRVFKSEDQVEIMPFTS